MAPPGGPQKGSKIQLCPILTKIGKKYPPLMKMNIWGKKFNYLHFGGQYGGKKGPNKIGLNITSSEEPVHGF